MDKTLRGYYAIAMTPFNEAGDLLWDELERECDWIVRAGAHGLVWPVNDSEQQTLSPAERLQGIELTVKAVGGRIPVVAGVADINQFGAVAAARAAGRAGADAVIAVPPWSVTMPRSLIRVYYQAIAEAAGVPVVIQNLDPPIGSSLSPAFIGELCREIPLVQYAKEERNPHGTCVSELVALKEPELLGVFTGGQLLGLVASYKRGAVGNMASPELADIHARIWDLLEAGDEAGARQLEQVEGLIYRAARTVDSHFNRKAILVRRGVFSSNARRNQGAITPDSVFMAEVEYVLSRLQPYLRV